MSLKIIWKNEGLWKLNCLSRSLTPWPQATKKSPSANLLNHCRWLPNPLKELLGNAPVHLPKLHIYPKLDFLLNRLTEITEKKNPIKNNKKIILFVDVLSSVIPSCILKKKWINFPAVILGKKSSIIDAIVKVAFSCFWKILIPRYCIINTRKIKRIEYASVKITPNHIPKKMSILAFLLVDNPSKIISLE